MKTSKILYIYLALAFFMACKEKNEADTKTEILATNEVSLTAAQAKNIDLQIAKVEMRRTSGVLKLNGQIDVPPQNLVSVSIPLGGYLKSTQMLPGTHVSKGQVIALMEDPQYIQLQQDYLSVKNRLNFAKQEFARQKELNSTKASSDKVVQQAETEMKNFSVEERALAEKLALIHINANSLSEKNMTRTIKIYAPISGYISKVNVNIGKYVTPSDVIFELVNPTDIHLNLTIFEKDLDKLAIGQKVLAYSNAKPDIKFETEVILVSHSLADDRSAEVHCHFERYDKSLVPGMYMNAEVQLKNITASTLPETSIVNFENKDYVFVETKPNTYKMTPVQTGVNADGFIEVKNDFKNQKIVSKGAYSLLMKMKNTAEED